MDSMYESIQRAIQGHESSAAAAAAAAAAAEGEGRRVGAMPPQPPPVSAVVDLGAYGSSSSSGGGGGGTKSTRHRLNFEAPQQQAASPAPAASTPSRPSADLTSRMSRSMADLKRLLAMVPK